MKSLNCSGQSVFSLKQKTIFFDEQIWPQLSSDLVFYDRFIPACNIAFVCQKKNCCKKTFLMLICTIVKESSGVLSTDFHFIKNNFTLKQSFEMTIARNLELRYSIQAMKGFLLRERLKKSCFEDKFGLFEDNVLFSICMHLFLVEVSVKNSQIVFFS